MVKSLRLHLGKRKQSLKTAQQAQKARSSLRHVFRMPRPVSEATPRVARHMSSSILYTIHILYIIMIYGMYSSSGSRSSRSLV